MRRHIFIEIKGDIDSQSLWNMIKSYKINLTALEGVSLIYGDVLLSDLGTIVESCALYGALKVEIGGGVSDEPKKNQET